MELAPIITYQLALETQLHSIFPNHDIHSNARKGTYINSPITGQYLEVDVWLPALDLCFEFQDEHHYKATWYSHTQLAHVQHKDNIKSRKIRERRHTLITVPYWWNGALQNLRETIAFHRPDLLLHKEGIEISSNPSIHFIKEKKQLMLASFLSSNEIDELHNNVWWIGEKWDGVRCYWDTSKQQLYSRQNVLISLAKPLENLFSNLMIDGELWCGRGFFNETVQYSVSDWEALNDAYVRIVCFDEASRGTYNHPFEARYSLLLSHLSVDTSVIIAPRFLCSDEEVMLRALQCIIEERGEGLIMRKPLSRYAYGRSKSLVKIKAYQDQEALVVQVAADGSLLLQLPNGSMLDVPQESSLLHEKPVKGDIVSLSLSCSQHKRPWHSLKDYLTGIRSNPVVHKIRSDLSWQDVIQGSALPIPLANESNAQHIDPNNQFVQKKQFYTPETSLNHMEAGKHRWKVIKERRQYFDEFAVSKGSDPLNPNFWYNVTQRDLKQYRIGYDAIVSYYGGKLPNTLMQLYPNIGLDRNLFDKVSNKQRKYFDDFAMSRREDPLNPNFWYRVTQQDFVQFRSGYFAIVSHYGGKLSNTLTHLYPDIGLQKDRFKEQSWKVVKEQRKYFDDFAMSKRSNPLNPNFWYNISLQELKQFRSGYVSIMAKYEGKLSKALMQLYPDIGLKPELFRQERMQQQLWTAVDKRKSFFDKFAEDKGNDSLNPNFWYGVTHQVFLQHSGGNQILSSYDFKLSKALLQLYPNIGLEKSRFSTRAML